MSKICYFTLYCPYCKKPINLVEVTCGEYVDRTKLLFDFTGKCPACGKEVEISNSDIQATKKDIVKNLYEGNTINVEVKSK